MGGWKLSTSISPPFPLSGKWLLVMSKFYVSLFCGAGNGTQHPIIHSTAGRYGKSPLSLHPSWNRKQPWSAREPEQRHACPHPAAHICTPCTPTWCLHWLYYHCHLALGSGPGSLRHTPARMKAELGVIPDAKPQKKRGRRALGFGTKAKGEQFHLNPGAQI